MYLIFKYLILYITIVREELCVAGYTVVDNLTKKKKSLSDCQWMAMIEIGANSTFKYVFNFTLPLTSTSLVDWIKALKKTLSRPYFGLDHCYSLNVDTKTWVVATPFSWSTTLNILRNWSIIYISVKEELVFIKFWNLYLIFI